MSSKGHNYSAEEISFILRRPRRRSASRGRGREGSWLNSLCASIVEHQLGLSITFLLLFGYIHLVFPNRHMRKFYTLSHYDPSSQKYAPGWSDLPFVLFWLNIFTGMRTAVMDYVLKPIALRGGVRRRKTAQRLSEQGWLVIYYSLSFAIGMSLWTESKYWLNLRELWTDFPDTTMTALMKWYYLVQFAFWLQQIVVINIEKLRKDYWQMTVHHVITCALLFTSYSFYMTRVGNAILCLMDVADIILSSAKVLRYLAYQTACDSAFGIFIATWFVTRQVFYPMIIWSVYFDLPVEMPLGCYDTVTGQKMPQSIGSSIAHYLQPFVHRGGMVCFDKRVHLWFLGLLITLQCILLVWFVMIVNVAARVMRGLGAADVRSDDESEEEEEQKDTPANCKDPVLKAVSKSQ